jgi:hypothetical protein
MANIMAGRGKHPFAGMGREALLKHCRVRFERDGVASLHFNSLQAVPGLYMNLYRCGLTQGVLLAHFGATEQFQHFKRNNWQRKIGERIQRGWTWDRIVADARAVAAVQGFLPAAAWFVANRQGSLVQSVYGLGKKWGDLRTDCDSFAGSAFIQSRNGMRWRSHPEASLSNFLYARGVEHSLGRKYPDDYSTRFGYTYGYYDLAFKSTDGRWFDVEVWGDKPNGHAENHYAKKRAAKEQYNEKNPQFIGIHHADCLNDGRLAEILSSLIGRVEPFVFDGPHDADLLSTHWSNADELLATCRVLMQKEWGGRVPNEEWLRKRGKFKNRPGPAYNTVSIYIRKWLGGIRNARKLLGKSADSTQTWDRDKALSAYLQFWRKWRQTPGRLRRRAKRGQIEITVAERREAGNIEHAGRKYVGDTATIHQLLGLPLPRKSGVKSNLA